MLKIKENLILELHKGFLPKSKTQLVFLKYWWVILFLLCTYIGFHHAMMQKSRVCSSLSNTLEEIQSEYAQALKKRDEALLRLSSHHDPEWVQMVLMEKLGLVPEGQTKVLFQKNDE